MMGFSISKLIFLIVVIGILVLLMKNKVLPNKKEEKDEKKAIDTTNMSKDPVCGTYVEEGSEHRLKYYGKVYYFCSDECMEKFKAQKKAEAVEKEHSA